MPGVTLPCVLGPAICDWVTPELEQFSQAKSLLDCHMTFAHTRPPEPEASSNTSWTLERIPGHLEPEPFTLADGQRVITLGRKKGNSKVCPGQKVSRHHISLIRSPGGWGVMDVGSTCGTFVNGESLDTNKVRTLATGDIISLGSSDTLEAGTYHYRVVEPALEEQDGDTDDEGFDDTPAPSPDIESEMLGEGLTGYESEPEEDNNKIPVETETDENIDFEEAHIKVEIDEDSKHIPIIRESFVRLTNCKESKMESFDCELCNFSSIDSGSLNIHIREEHIDISYPCDECDYSADSQEKLANHLVSIHENVDEELTDTKHVEIIEFKTDKPKYCTTCEKHFINYSSFKEHNDRVHLKVIYNCEQCEYSTRWKNSLRIHIEHEHEKKIYKCDLCEFETKAKAYLSDHTKKAHGSKFYCDQCPHRARDATRLAMHKQTAHSDIEIKCDLCDFVCKHKRFLQRHMKTMHEEKRFVCQECGCKFSLQGLLNRHLRDSHNDTDFVCDQCDFTTKNKARFKRHVNKVHLGIKYKCRHCDHESVSEKAKRQHEKVVHENVRYPCHICDHVFNTKCNLMKHLERPDHGGRGTNWRLKEQGIKQKNYRKKKAET